MSRTVRVPLSKVLRYSAAAVSQQSLRSAARRLVHGPPPLHVWDSVAAAVLAVFGASATRGLETLLFATASAMLLLVRRLPLPVTTAIAALTVTGLTLVTTYGYVDGQVLNLSGGNALVGPSLVLLAAAGFLCASSAPLDWRLGIPLVPLLLAPQRSMLALGLLLGLAVGAAWAARPAPAGSRHAPTSWSG
ncbi:MAG: hypothetical protein M3452_07970 [Chloroflexota bacterium]|nr:hypothetical protein [Chloroflexota bacterium]